MKVQKETFLHALESVSPGLSPREIIEQSNCFAFRKGKVMTFNDELTCCGPSLLDDSFAGAVKAAKLLDLLRKIPEEEIEVSQADGEMIVAGKTGTNYFAMEVEVSLPIDQVDVPEKWKPLDPDFGEAVKMVADCASHDQSAFALTCVHVHPKWVEAFDGFQTCRWKLATGLEKPNLVRAASIRHVSALGMAELSETKSWLHFRNAGGLVLSVRKYVEEYPEDIGGFLKGDKGTPVQLPKQLADETGISSIFSMENAEENYLVVEMKAGKIRVKGIGVTGRRISRGKKVTWTGPDMMFHIKPDLLASIVKDHSECFMTETRLLVSGGNWRYAAALGKPGKGKEETNGEGEE
mgnify:CR=1 FL=1